MPTMGIVRVTATGSSGGGTPTGVATGSATRTATSPGTRTPNRSNEDDGCAIVPPQQPAWSMSPLSLLLIALRAWRGKRRD